MLAVGGCGTQMMAPGIECAMVVKSLHRRMGHLAAFLEGGRRLCHTLAQFLAARPHMLVPNPVVALKCLGSRTLLSS